MERTTASARARDFDREREKEQTAHVPIIHRYYVYIYIYRYLTEDMLITKRATGARERETLCMSSHSNHPPRGSHTRAHVREHV